MRCAARGRFCGRSSARETKMAETETKKKTYRSTAFAPKGKAAKKEKETPDARQIVLTLSVPDGDVLKVETIDKSGHRHAMPEEEFMALAGDDDAEDLGAVLEGAYTA